MRAIDKEGFEPRLAGYVASIAAVAAKNFAKNYPNIEVPKYELEVGNRYVKVVKLSHGSRSVHSFVDRSNGDILKAASWRAPAKHPRGNVFEEDFGMAKSGAHEFGVRYL